ncbi:formate/nitrite transporter family protein [Afifella marina]|uniref:Formate/nitrite transporter FocA, FNT family n=2 Tax=Hyphomicrobiales TaxID=356 RepID=A0A1G5N709_AFIMA|nr:formate/nitrite transporter family protein [Afifella marina]MBK1622502.1 transporter (formate/nitrite transporter family protein) [Afifella marina DSM 2698]MBK1626783.1 transporter (formate/nitrite transporter family protein) [Afifella marina]MBK5919287.1 transporter (formate/nitrite transporter family protein) [Afifella marina]RAI21325.1 transporter (formate/nitrite transporter family protein) [Afifella marina DSM 2698]SCZ32551.1 Formate/nitrite transporter FocA, FNT family [Afifella marin
MSDTQNEQNEKPTKRNEERASRGAERAQDSRGLTQREAKTVEKRLRLSVPAIYEVVRQEGEEEMERPTSSLWWSGIAAGLSIGFSLVAEAALREHLPDAPWRPLVDNFGYCVGFLLVILARQQLFTENTIAPILPLAAEFTRKNVLCVMRLWSVVFIANMVGTLGVALFNAALPGTHPEVFQAMLEISREMMDKSWFTMFVRAIGAGFLIAAIVWILPSASGSEFLVIVLFTYIIAIAEFTHIIAGSVEAFLLVAHGDISIFTMIWDFTVPVLIGNILGGTALFALLAYAQVKEEIK